MIFLLVPAPCALIISKLPTVLGISFQNCQIRLIPPDAIEGLIARRKQRLRNRDISLHAHRRVLALRDTAIPK